MAKEESCIHYWVIGTPGGRYSLGKCKYCGETRGDFRNSYDEKAGQWHQRAPVKR